MARLPRGARGTLKQMLDASACWMDAQHETPSFSLDNFADRVDRLLSAPLPPCLRGPSDKTKKPTNTIASTAYGRDPREPIHEHLLALGRLAAERRDDLRRQAVAAELSALCAAPGVPRSGGPPRERSPVESRLLRRAREAAAKRAALAEAVAAQRDSELRAAAPFRPEITRRARAAAPVARRLAEGFAVHGGGERLAAEAQRRAEVRRAEVRGERLAAELAEVRAAPQISARSERLAARQRARDGLAGLPPEEALLLRHRVAELRRWERREAERQRMAATPQITLRAAALHRDGDAALRLHAESARRAAQATAASAVMNEIDTASGTGTGTGTPARKAFAPRISARAAALWRDESVEEALLRRHREAEAAMASKRRSEAEAEAARRRPLVDPVSDAIAARRPETARERLYAPRVALCSEERNRAAAGREQMPARRSTSLTGSTAARSLEQRYDAMQSYDARRRERLEALRSAAEDREREVCTFAPATNRQRSMSLDGGGGGGGGGALSVARRGEQWMARRDAKIREARAQQSAAAEPSGPLGHVEKAERAERAPAVSVYGGDGTPWGVREFLQRQEDARRERKRREESAQRFSSSSGAAHALSSTASTSSGVTKPVPFELGRRDRVHVRSLRRPPHVPLLSPERDDHSGDGEADVSEIMHDGDLAAYERIYNRIYNSAAGADALTRDEPSIYR